MGRCWDADGGVREDSVQEQKGNQWWCVPVPFSPLPSARGLVHSQWSTARRALEERRVSLPTDGRGSLQYPQTCFRPYREAWPVCPHTHICKRAPGSLSAAHLSAGRPTATSTKEISVAIGNFIARSIVPSRSSAGSVARARGASYSVQGRVIVAAPLAQSLIPAGGRDGMHAHHPCPATLGSHCSC